MLQRHSLTRPKPYEFMHHEILQSLRMTLTQNHPSITKKNYYIKFTRQG